MKPEYVLPAKELEAFNCPRCHVYTRQVWFRLQGSEAPDGSGSQTESLEFLLSKCDKCKAITIWRDEEIIYPVTGLVPPANPDLPDGIQEDYEEAAKIVASSPRGAAALLRLAIQKICKDQGEPGQNLNGDIGALVEKGLPARTQQALDSVRVIGNSAVHPGQIDLNDNRELANALFKLVNFIGEKFYTEPKELNQIYDSLPEGVRNGIQQRDKK